MSPSPRILRSASFSSNSGASKSGARVGRVVFSAALLGVVASACLTESSSSSPSGGTAGSGVVSSGGSTGNMVGSAGSIGSSGASSNTGGSSTGTSGGAATTGGTGTGTGGSTATGPTSDLVDDLEDNDARILMTGGRQGSWYAFSDGTITPAPPDDNGNTNGFAPGSPGADSSMHAAHVTANGFGTYAGLAVDFNNSGVRPKDTADRKTYDVSGYDGIVFKAKGTASGTMRVLAVTKQITGTSEGGTCDDSNSSNHCWDSYGKDFTLASDWTEVRVRFSDMTTDNTSPFDPTAVFGLAFQLNASNGNLDFWVDDLALFKDGTTTGGGTAGTGNTGGTGSGAGGMSSGTAGSGSSQPTACTLPGSPSPGSASFTYYYFGQGTAKGNNGEYKTACGYTGTESGMVDTVTNIVSPTYFAAIPGANNFDSVGHCGECVQISNGGKSIVATIIDECPTDDPNNPNTPCKSAGHLDLSKAALDALGFSTGDPSGTSWSYISCPVTGNVQISYNAAADIYIQNIPLPIQSVKMGGASGNHTSYGSWQFGSAVQGQTLTITDIAGRTITVTAGNGDAGKQFPGCTN